MTVEFALSFCQQLLMSEVGPSKASPAVIGDYLDNILKLDPGLMAERQAMLDELIRRFSVWVGQDARLKDSTGHQPWLSSARKVGWRYWPRYQTWCNRDLSSSSLVALDTSTDWVLGQLEDPSRPGSWDRRGLVVGQVQSGKTAHYSGLICKAADAGYKIIIVLAGLHNNLRSQTQTRLDEAFLGYETTPLGEELRRTGVGQIDPDPAINPNYATNRTEGGDFKAAVLKNLGITPEARPWLFVVKKNKSVLDKLLFWIRERVADRVDPESGRKTVSNLPLLVIDDEADHGSVDTANQVFDQDGVPDPDHQPKAINRCIRRLLSSFQRSAYVGYTATPFANIFIHEKGRTAGEGPDLFPSSFIVNLGTPDDYVGPAKVFGLKGPDGRQGGLGLVRIVDDFATDNGTGGWMPVRHDKHHVPRFAGPHNLPGSLVEALDLFLLGCAVRELRGQGQKHCSMLVHVTRFNAVQQQVHRQVSEYLVWVRQRLQLGVDLAPLAARLEHLFNTNIVEKWRLLREREPGVVPATMPSWPEAFATLQRMIGDIELRMINGSAGDTLEYKAKEGIGLKVIAIGGDKLSRGLTLEGLTVSYFLRASRMYDTLMQMGRWFGYRPGYLDLCRLYLPQDLHDWFGLISDASDELREEFDYMVSAQATPREYGLGVQSHPGLLVTSPLKMRSAVTLDLSFSGRLSETVVFFRDQDRLLKNLEATKNLVRQLGAPNQTEPVRSRPGGSKHTWTGHLWEQVPADLVVEFFDSYQPHPDSRKVQGGLLARFVREMSGQGELTSWTVAFLGAPGGKRLDLKPDLAVTMVKRKDDSSSASRYSIGRLVSPRDEAIDLDADAWQAALALTNLNWRETEKQGQAGRAIEAPDQPSGVAIRQIRGLGAAGVAPHPERGLLLLYCIDPAGSELEFPVDSHPVIGFGASFPGSQTRHTVQFKCNNILVNIWGGEFGPSD